MKAEITELKVKVEEPKITYQDLKPGEMGRIIGFYIKGSDANRHIGVCLLATKNGCIIFHIPTNPEIDWKIGESFSNILYYLERVEINSQGNIVPIKDNKQFKKPEFSPVKLEITAESLDELKDLWARFNVPIEEVEKFNEYYINGEKYSNSIRAFCELNNFIHHNYPSVLKN